WANLKPEAFAGGPLSVEGVLAARRVSDPLSASDCFLVSDGACACVVVRAEPSRHLPNAPVYFPGAARAQWHRSIVSMPDLTVTAASESAPRAMQMAGVRHADIDLVMLYDAFTINT
ncbi:thiolase C-terminal domain-containing protein, partial [Pseudomonas aeruginosa]